jgi:cAMP-binding proteins - catabolite gene activator and regulatory subunit of cAMP-dependent protein kinases
MEKPELIERLLAHCQRMHFAAKSSILRQGAPANDLYYILSGAVSVTLQMRTVVNSYFLI